MDREEKLNLRSHNTSYWFNRGGH